jgi:hypothetical protein
MSFGERTLSITGFKSGNTPHYGAFTWPNRDFALAAVR